jgi:hypothetical protein
MRSPITSSILALTLTASVATAQTKITPPENNYKIEQDVELGREAAGEVRQQLPILRNEQATSYVEDLGRTLVAAIPPELRTDRFRYSFDVVNVRDINAFALPGGPMFVNRGMIEAAKNEGEVAGVMAHEISHVALRHGTAQASKAAPYQWGGVAGAIAGAIIGGNWGRVVSEGTQFGLGVSFLRYGRDFERQADLLGAQIMARAGYDPRDMANMFRTIEKQGGSGGPEWLSSHPNPGNRYEAINKEAQVLRVSNPVRDSGQFQRVKAALSRLPKAPTTEEATRRRTSRSGGPVGGDLPPTGRVEAPSTRYNEYRQGNLFTISVPANWRESGEGENGAVTFAPDGAYGRVNGQSHFTHGVEIGLSRKDAEDLRAATDDLIDTLRQGNPNLTRGNGYQQGSIDGRRALRTTLNNVSDATGSRETIDVSTTQTRTGDLMYVIGVAPRSEFASYQPVFNRIVQSIRWND